MTINYIMMCSNYVWLVFGFNNDTINGIMNNMYIYIYIIMELSCNIIKINSLYIS